MADNRLPITLLTGFLGAGKSTLLNRVLSTTDEKIAVVVNEFGEVGLDHDLIETSDEEVVLLSSGCICCSISGELSQTLMDLIRRRAYGELDFDRVVIETTGLADPAPIRQLILGDHYLSRVAVMDGVVTLVDAVNGQKTLDDQFEAVSQAATADLILMTKTDLAAQPEVDALRQRIEGLNPTAQILEVSAAVADPTVLWGLSAIRRGADADTALAWMTRAPSPAPAADPFANLSGLTKSAPVQHGFSAHDARIASASITLDAPLEDAVFDRWLETLVAVKGRNLLRVKGIVFLKGIDTPFVFHGVQHLFEPPVPLKNWPEGDTTTRVVVIARDMTEAQLERSLDMLRAEAVEKSKPLFPGWKKTEGANWE
ncbi:GTP-binding protein [Epibacterium sp. SM1979]|uniref:GTP-binding protein n=1 Tax=Tritonibacter litoralis TaxID=2662264 RepID=A0A843YIP6_9RHOB|nr:GTP-binding protein [Tritonibacter litoralis]MQQ09019.1 GTP-binding protein [Tritonibacter litoralis]